MIANYWDAVAVGSDLGLYVFFTQKRKKRPLCVRLPMVCLCVCYRRNCDVSHPRQDDQELIEADVMSVAWGLSHNAPFEPVIIFSRGSVAYIYSIVREGMAGYIRGHGGVSDGWPAVPALKA
jgi:polycomb protein EED